MTITGSCLCGGVRFEIDRIAGPFEICHCNRCRKLSGSIGMPAVWVDASDYRLISGQELIASYAAPLIYQPPAYESFFCSKCGSPIPPPPDREEHGFEIPAGLLDDDPGVRPDKHIFVEFVPPWDSISDAIPQFRLPELVRLRTGRELPDDFELKTHYDAGRDE